jgi:hypothetical protein
MPVKRRISKRRRNDINEQEDAWLHGDDSACGFVEFKQEDQLKDFWRAHRTGIIADHVAEFPGTRPLRFWDYDAPDALGESESEAAYLERHDLFLPGERRRVPNASFLIIS